MTSLITFYLSGIIGKKVFDDNDKPIGIIKDLLIDNVSSNQDGSPTRPLVHGVKLKIGSEIKVFSFAHFTVLKEKGKLKITCSHLAEQSTESINDRLFLADTILDKQIVDLNGRKVVRVNDVRLVNVSDGIYAIAVDIGIEGLLRRIGIDRPIKSLLSIFKIMIPAKFILWDDVQAIDFSNYNIKLSKSYTKLHTLHPSDLADIIEDLGKHSRATIFSSLDHEKAADVLEELEPHAQIHIIESLSVDKAADVLEKMPADEVADILDELGTEKAEMLLNEMETESSQDVRDLLEYSDNSVGSIMISEIFSFVPTKTVDEVIQELRVMKPEKDGLYNLFVADSKDTLIGTFTLRDLIIADPETEISQIMKQDPIFLFDDQGIDDIAEIFSKYNLLAIPVVNNINRLEGMVVIDDVVEDLIKNRRTAKR